MRLLSERWTEHVLKNEGIFTDGERGELTKELYDTLSAYDMDKLTLEVIEGYPEPDCGLTLFTEYSLRFFLNQTEGDRRKVEVNVSTEHIPVIQVDGVTSTLEEYFQINQLAAYELGNLFIEFAEKQLSFSM